MERCPTSTGGMKHAVSAMVDVASEFWHRVEDRWFQYRYGQGAYEQVPGSSV